MVEGNETIVPSGKWSVLLSGLGFYKLSQQRRRLLTYVFFGSLAAHLVGLLMFGGWIVMRSKPEEAPIFKTPPPVRKYEPRKLEHRVKLRKRQRSSSRPSMMPRLVSMKMSDVALPEIKLNPKIIHTTFQPKFKAVSGRGLGAGLGTGYGTHGFGLGVSSFNFFGIHARGEKIAILVDASVSMIEEERGGEAGYTRVKQRIGEVVDALSDGALFNLFVFADGASAMEKQMVIANNDNRKRAKLFLRPFNTMGNWGLKVGNLQPSSLGLAAVGGTTRLDLVLTASFEQGADTILVISDGAPMVKRGYTPEQVRAWRARQLKWADEHAAEIETWQGLQARAVGRKVWVPPTPARPARPPKKGPPKEGQAIDKGSPAVPAKPGYWKVVYDLPSRPSPPKMPDAGWWTLNDFIQHLKILHEHFYLKKGRKPPVIHCIGYQIDKMGHAFLQKLARTYHGKYRRVKKIKS